MRFHSKRCVIAGAVLAGGNACRMQGIAKGTLKLDSGVSIIERLMGGMNQADISDIVIIANDPKPYKDYGVEIIADLRDDIGPIGGVETGLVSLAPRYDAVMFLPCDLPHFSVNHILKLKQAFLETSAPAVFATTSDQDWHPLCAVVDSSLAEQVSAAIDFGERRIRRVWQQVDAVRVQFPDESAFLNINSLEDVRRWQSLENESARQNSHDRTEPSSLPTSSPPGQATFHKVV